MPKHAIAYLRAGYVPKPLQPAFGEYFGMFEQLFAQYAPQLQLHCFDVQQGHYPQDMDAFAGFLICGSPSSVYDTEPWIEPLQAYIVRLHQQQRKLVGICFGHQIIARALGGDVAKAPQGWGLGIQTTKLRPGHPLAQAKLHYSHQDQVLTPPTAAQTIAQSAHCPHAMLRIGEHILTMQGHPEFSGAYCAALIRSRQERLPAKQVEEALQSLQQNNHNDALAGWIGDFFTP
ncbi:glutamine amidotransferase-related protein [Magnetococcus sp. PR-3]|uniref:glutamine amidotransferase-related protein n=1 Tax=Magnetococcus sp. PR-3 TaxID=3120355 RepID=UPI002FCDE2F8